MTGGFSRICEEYDIIVIGGGHAGCEAALSSARLGKKTVMFCVNIDSIAAMPCNPNIGGTSKGHLVREIDALGGEMGRNIDKTFIQSKMLNVGKGPAVHSLRAQADKARYAGEMRKTLERAENLHIRQSEITDIAVENGGVTGVISESGAFYKSKCVILAAGTYMRARCLYGDVVTESGPGGMKASTKLSESLKNHGIPLYRFKTGTPARVSRGSIDFTGLVAQSGDEPVTPFSFENINTDLNREQALCWITHTNEKTHEIIRENIHRSPMYSGVIEGTGTRYCPSIEDKVVRFAEKTSHQLFIEPEGEDSDEMYIAGMSSSMPEDVQVLMYRSVKGLENCRIIRNAYAIEYDCLDATCLKLSLEFKGINGLFSAGQFNGSSGYEEAAAQGLIAGINAAHKCDGKPPLIIDRSEGYIGVLIDDLVTKGTSEPYRMMTSRAEYRLLLRQDNADLRLTEHGYNAGLISEERYSRFLARKAHIEKEIARVNKAVVTPDNVNALLRSYNSAAVSTGMHLAELIKRPELSYEALAPADFARPGLSPDEREQVNISIKYEGYIERQKKQVEQFKKLEGKRISPDFNYDAVKNLRLEARQKLSSIRPENIGQASRITGVSPADISVLLVAMKR